MYEYNFKLIKIVDGDTVDIDIDLGFGIWLRNQRIRIMGIDTPESRTSDPEEKKFGKLATEQVKRYMATATKFYSFQDEKGKYGRILGDFEIYDSRKDCASSLVKIMIEDGYGVAYEGQSKVEIIEAHLKNRERLIAEGKVNG